MKIIDVSLKGNVVRFYLGEKTDDWGRTNKDYKDSEGKTPTWLKPSDKYYGDDWNDNPYEHNAGGVYDEFIKGTKDAKFNFDDLILEPSSDYDNPGYSKEDMVDRKVPCLVIVPHKEINWDNMFDGFSSWAASDKSIKIYFGDDEEVIDEALRKCE